MPLVHRGRNKRLNHASKCKSVEKTNDGRALSDRRRLIWTEAMRKMFFFFFTFSFSLIYFLISYFSSRTSQCGECRCCHHFQQKLRRSLPVDHVPDGDSQQNVLFHQRSTTNTVIINKFDLNRLKYN